MIRNGDDLRAARKRLGMTLKDAASVLRLQGVDPGKRVMDMEAGIRPVAGPTAVTFELLEFIQRLERQTPGVVDRCRREVFDV